MPTWSGPLTDQSGVIAATDVSQEAAPAKPGRKYLLVHNPGRAGHPGTGSIEIADTPLDGDTVEVAGTVYEFEIAGGVTPPNIEVAVGGTDEENAANLRAAIVAEQAAVVHSALRVGALTFVDLITVENDVALALAESTVGARIAVVDNADEAPAAESVLPIWVNFGDDAARGKPSIRIEPTGGYEWPKGGFVSDEAVNVLGTVGSEYVVKEA